MSAPDVPPQLSVRHGPGTHDPDDSTSVSNSEGRGKGCLAAHGRPAKYVTEELRALRRQRADLEKVERELAEKYGMCVKRIDSVEVRREAKARERGGSEDSILHAAQLHELFHLRKRLISITPKTPIINSPIPVPNRRTDAARFWAVVIGIDGYSGGKELRGCASDAVSVATYLFQDLGVPKHRIQCLIDSSHEHEFSSEIISPSRANITATLYGLIDHPDISRDENIIIYFAGHGSFYCSEGSGASEVIEALCPIDRGLTNPSGARIYDICDREINTILSEISRAKGHKITVILDCCHSGGATRDPLGGTPRIVHGVDSVSFDDVLRVADEDLKAKGFADYKSIRSEEWLPNMDSHVVLAACEAFQQAMEMENAGKQVAGFFTTHLLDALKSGSLTDETTYHTLLDLIPISETQTPVTAGKNTDALLWFQDRE